MEQINIISKLNDNGFNAIPFGYKTPAAPYVVVKPEKDPLSRGTIFRVIAHDNKGQVFRVNDTITSIITLLSGLGTLKAESKDFNPYIFPNNDDGTISREHTFLMISKY
jgi:hypothetical protein